MSAAVVHPSADVQAKNIGDGTIVWQYVVILGGATIGRDANICSHCFIENDVVIGDRVTIKCGVQLWDGLRIGNDVFVGPNVTFTNDKFPRSKERPERFLSTVVGDGASIGGGAVILPGLKIGKGATIGAGAVVTQSVPAYAIAVGNPARIIGYVDHGKGEAASAAVAAPAAPGAGPVRIGIGEVTLYHLRLVPDMRGDLSAGEFPRDIPFLPKRYFLVFNVPSVKTRGEHAHRRCHQFLICVKGSVAVVVDDGRNRREVLLDAPNQGLHLPPMTWGIQYKYSADAVLLVFASDYYDAGDYIRDYTEFTALVRAEAARS
jgi:UDP-2-acetamido-3-amino-2,3-dideoxy-glucuronate N-acetyltransferase